MFSSGKVTPEAVAPSAPIMEAMLIAMDTLGIRDIIAMPRAIVVSMNRMELAFMESRLPCRGIPPMVKNTALANNVWVMKMTA